MLRDLLNDIMVLIEFYQLREKYRNRTSYQQDSDNSNLPEGMMTNQILKRLATLNSAEFRRTIKRCEDQGLLP